MNDKAVTVVAIAIVLIFGIAATAVAVADDLTWSWNPPTERTDGTALPASDIEGYRMKLNSVEQPNLLTAGVNNITVTAPAGQMCASFATEDTGGRKSVWTTDVCKTVLAPPGEPTSVTVTIVIGP